MDTPTTTRFAAWCHRAAMFLRRSFRRALGLTIGGVAAVWSFDTLNNLAMFLGFGHLSWMFPLCIDAVAAFGMDYWMTHSPAWRAGRAMALSAIAVSIAGNVSDWLLRDVNPLAALFGIIPPTALAAVLGIAHRNAAMIADEQDEAERRRKAAEQRKPRQAKAERPVEKITEPPRLTVLEPARDLPASDQERVQALVRLAEQTGKPPTKRQVMAHLRVGSGPAMRLSRTVREIVTTTTETVETGTGD